MTGARSQADSLADVLAGGPTLAGDLEADRAREATRRSLFGDAASVRTVRIGRFTVLERIGTGGMGVVYSAYDPELDRKVAVKILHRLTGSGSGTDATPRLVREAQALARISHPNVVGVYEVGTHDEQVFIAMEFVPGVTLGVWQRQPERDWRTILAAYCDAGRGLAAAHAAGLVHRDFKPHNVIVDRDGRARVLDFGLARPVTDGVEDQAAEGRASVLDSLVTKTGAVMGTPAYMSPEQHAGRPAGPASDQFSFCVATWEALAEQRPFAGVSVAALARNVIDGVIVAPPARHPCPALFDVLRRGLADAPEDRYADMNALLAAIDRASAPRDPGDRRRWIAALALGLTAVGVASWAALDRDEPALVDVCQASGDALVGAWDRERRARVEAAFARSELPYAQDSAARVSAELDRYAAQWLAAREDTCRATHDRGERSEALLDRSMTCLDQRRQRLAAVVERLSEADAALVERAQTLVAKLEPIEACRDRAALLSDIAPPADPATRTAVAGVRAELAEASSLREAGHYADGLALAEALETRTAGIDYPPIRAEVVVERGRALSATGAYTEAEAALARGYWAAIDAGHDRLAIDAAIVLASVVGDHGARSEAGLSWARQAETVVRRAGLDADAQLAVAMARAKLLDRAGDYAEAVRGYEAGLALGDDSSPQRFKLYGALGNAALRAGDYEAARRYQQRAVELARAQLGDDHPEVASTLFNLGTVDYSQGDLQAALLAFEAAAAHYERVLGPDHPHLGNALNGVGVVLDELGRYEDAIVAYQRSLTILRKVHGDEHPAVAARLDNLATSLVHLGRADEAEPMKLEALAILRATLGEEHPEVGIALNGLGLLEFERGRYAEALSYHRQALRLWTAALDPDHPDLAEALVGQCRSLVQLGHVREAVADCERALAIREGAEVGPHLIAEAKLQLGEARALLSERQIAD